MRAGVAVIGSYAELEVIEGCERFQASEFATETVAATEIEAQATFDDGRWLEVGVVRGTAAAAASFSVAALAVAAA